MRKLYDEMENQIRLEKDRILTEVSNTRVFKHIISEIVRCASTDAYTDYLIQFVPYGHWRIADWDLYVIIRNHHGDQDEQ